MSLPDTEAIQQSAPTHRWNWKRCGIALLLAILVVGLGQLYDRRWRLAIAYEIAIPIVCVIARETIIRAIAAGLVVLLFGVLLQLFIIGQAVWLSLHRPRGMAMPRIGKLPLVAAVTIAVVTTIGWGTGFVQGHILGFKGYKISSDSMAPTLRTGDRVLVDARAFATSAPQRGDLVVFTEAPNFMLVKRVIGLGGDTLDFTNDGIVLDGRGLKESYIAPPDPAGNTQRVFPEHTVGPGDVFLLGDNRDNSYDSRYFGDISDKAVVGKVIGIYWSQDRSRIGTAVR